MVAGLVSAISLMGQNQLLYGNIFNQSGENLIGATVQWEDSGEGTVSDENGEFWLARRTDTAWLLVQYVGIEPSLVEVWPEEDSLFILVEEVVELNTVEVTAGAKDQYTSTLNTGNLEYVSSKELRKAPCCSLAESFETTGAVDVAIQDAVTSAKEVQMLGLRGVYTQMLLEKRPTLYGLATPLGLDFIPGTWIQGIQISKGSSTVQSGYGGAAGQINVELAKPWQDKPLFINAFGSTTERGELNVHLNHKWNDEWSSGVLLHGSTVRGEFDKNGDTFTDLPKKTSLIGLFRTFYRGEFLRSQLNLHVVSDERSSGQIAALLPDGTLPYTIQQQNDRAELFGKIGYLGLANDHSSIGFIYSLSRHKTANRFGLSEYTGTQNSAYANLVFSSAFANEDHKWNLGASYQYDDYEEMLDAEDLSRREKLPGVFAEYVYEPHVGAGFWNKIGVIAGARLDHHNRYGLLFTPRLNIKYNFDEETILRFSAGKAWRTAQVLSENLSVLASSRHLIFETELDIEEATNVGLNFTKNFDIGHKHLQLVIDAYHTRFEQQVVMDMEYEHGSVLFYNLDGRSRSNSLLVSLNYELLEGLDVKAIWKYNDVRIDYKDGFRQKPLHAPHQALVTVDYETPSENWMFNLNAQIVGSQRFADDHQVPAEFKDQFSGNTPVYTIFNAQVTRRFKNLELYAGGENLTDYRQDHAIIDFDNPFGEHFDAMQVWAPLVGARAYVGLRWWIESSK